VPEYLVEFSEAVVYLPDHPHGQRHVRALCVQSDTPRYAELHALRTTRGPGEIVAIRRVEDVDPEVVAVARSQFGVPAVPRGDEQVVVHA
jgi:hypothetical protein